MAIKTSFSYRDFQEILRAYRIGQLVSAEPIAQGTVQTNYFLVTTEGKYVFRYYESRSIGSVLFELNLLLFLSRLGYPSPTPIANAQAEHVALFQEKPFMICTFVEGRSPSELNARQKHQLIQQAAELQCLTLDYRPQFVEHRWNYTPDFCRRMARERAAEVGTQAAREKLEWYKEIVRGLELPDGLPKAICHADYHASNVLFHGDTFSGIVDFDDANYSYATFDLACLVDSWAWTYPNTSLDLAEAAKIVGVYEHHRALGALEKNHLFDVLKLSILVDCLWFFARGSGTEFYERQKIEYLEQMGRERLVIALFS